MQLIDTHCHIHEPDYPDAEGAYNRAKTDGVSPIICVGTDVKSSQAAVTFATNHSAVWASIGVHPHEAAVENLVELFTIITTPAVPPAASQEEGQGFHDQIIAKKEKQKIVAIGECGLDYFYTHSPKTDQIKALRQQIELAIAYNLPLIFHVRDAFDDFWPIFDEYKGLRGVLHSFTDNQANLDKALSRGLYIGVNGIMTFTKLTWQQRLIKQVPLSAMLLETDAPFLTPVPHRGTVNEPARVLQIANFLASIRDDSLEDIAAKTTHNARQLFSI